MSDIHKDGKGIGAQNFKQLEGGRVRNRPTLLNIGDRHAAHMASKQIAEASVNETKNSRTKRETAVRASKVILGLALTAAAIAKPVPVEAGPEVMTRAQGKEAPAALTNQSSEKQPLLGAAHHEIVVTQAGDDQRMIAQRADRQFGVKVTNPNYREQQIKVINSEDSHPDPGDVYSVPVPGETDTLQESTSQPPTLQQEIQSRGPDIHVG